ncbi:MAG: D-alanyl-D-alanine carboxypeptidase [Lachnospiraceae bacterium]|nr:D-alanyl-D-alanine carboxypeptidase [Lachnospiraceae bacterium]
MYGYGNEQYRLSDSYRRKRPKKLIWILAGAAVLLIVAGLIFTLVHVIRERKAADDEETKEIAVSEAAAAAGPVMVPVDTPVWQGEEESSIEEYEPLKVEPDDRTVGVSDEVVSEYAVLISLSENRVVAARNCRQKMYPASMTKVLTVLVAAENLRDMSALDDIFEMTQAIEGFSYENGCSNVGFMPGEKIPVKDLFYGTILPSGADAAMGLAEYIAGSQEAFVDMMNEKAAELGISETSHFTNCVGLYDDEHYTTAMDMAVIMDAAMKNDVSREALTRHIYTTTATAEHPDGITVSNWFLRRIEDKQETGQVLGAKTGFVNQSKNCAVSYGVSDEGKPFICVTGSSSSSWRCIYDHVDIYTNLAF